MKPRHLVLAVVAGMLVLATSLPGWAKKKQGKNEIEAIQFLGTVDCYWYPEAQAVLIQSLLEDPREDVRYAAVLAITEQLQRGKAPLNPLNGWRKFPDPLILTQISRVATGHKPLTPDELYERYSQRKLDAANKKGRRRGDTCRGCCNEEVMSALSRVAFEMDDTLCYVEPSARVRLAAERALRLCCDAESAPGTMPVMPPVPLLADAPTGQPSDAAPSDVAPSPVPIAPAFPVVEQSAGFTPSFGRRSGPIGANIGIAGRADTTNRFNLFDNMGAAPRTRVFFGYQFVQGQNNAVFITNQNEQLFSLLDTQTGRAAFIAFTGFGSGLGTLGGGGDVAVDPSDPASADVLKNLYLAQNAGRTEAFLLNPDSNLYRFGFEYAVTTDFSVSMQAQYVQPIDDVQQPAMFSNPQVLLKHVIYRDDLTLISSLLGIQPQIPKPAFAIGEDTSRILPGTMFYRQLSEKWFLQGATGFSLPSESSQIKTWDYVLGVGLWLYKHESLMRDYKGEESNAFLLGVIPQFEVLGKHVIGSNDVPGLFDLSAEPPQTAPGTLSPVDGTRTVYLPQDPTIPVNQVALIFEEPRHVVDLTTAVTFLFRNNVQWSAGVSVPVTGGSARELEFLTTLNIGY